MKNRYKFWTSILFFSLLFVSPNLRAQGLQETLSNLSADAAQSYVRPIVNGFGANLNSGWFAYPPDAVKLGFTLRARVVGNGTFFSSDDKTFSTTGSYRFTDEQAHSILVNSGIQPGDPRYTPTKAAILGRDWD